MHAGQLTPAKPGGALTGKVTSAQKAAIIVRFLMTEGANVPLSDLSADMQATLAHEMGQLRRIDRDTLMSIVEEFANELEMTGLTFPKGVAGALSALDGQISPQAAAQLRRKTGVLAEEDPWDEVRGFAVDDLVEVIVSESIEVSAIIISKIDVKKAAEILSKLPGEKARRITYAVSRTVQITPQSVERIGRALVQQKNSAPVPAFARPAGERVGAILNSTRSETREDVLQGLTEEDEVFAKEVRRAIFTFKHIATRVDARDIPVVMRAVDGDTLTLALAAGLQDDSLLPSAEHILKNVSARLSEQMRETIADLGTPDQAAAEHAQSDVVAAIRDLASEGEILLVEAEDA